MAEILKAKDTTRPEGPLVAVKRILPHLTDDKQYVTMFLDESRVLARLEHDNIIRTLEVGQVGETPFIALEYVWGQDARMLFHRARRSEQRIPIAIACYIVAEACAALHHAHGHEDQDGNLLGLVHRDVSLQNIMVSYAGAVKLTDFGIAMSTQNVARTEAGIVKGKFGYMSPEQIRGEPMDRRSDVFAAGICLYELLTSERLFSGESDYAAVEKVRAVAVELPSRFNREIPSTLEATVMKALAKHPRDRYQSAADLRRALLSFMAESHNECSGNDLAHYMSTVFADELSRQPTPDALRRDARPRNDEPTGLAAFDNLDPVSTISGTSAVHASPVGMGGNAPSVPPIIPRRDSVPAARGESDMHLRPESPSSIRSATASAEFAVMEGAVEAPGWDDDELTIAAERASSDDELAELTAEDTGDDDVTRQLYVGETFSGVSISGSGMRKSGPVPMPSSSSTPSPFDVQRAAAPDFELPLYPRVPQTSYATVVGIVLGIIAIIAGALYLTRGARPAEIHLSTAPLDAEVRVDGRRALGTASPFVIADLAPGREHQVEVVRAGYRGWRTRLALTSGQVLELPLVTLEPEPAAPTGTPLDLAAAPVRGTEGTRLPGAASLLAEPPTPRRAPELGTRGQSPLAAPARAAKVEPATRPSAKAATTKSPASAARKAAPAVAAAAASTGTGVLRINSRPWAELTIDGRPAGNTPQMNLQLPAGVHTVRLSNPQFGLTKTIKVQIAAGRVVTQVVSLQ
jgi:serine/threonine protein kinase